MNFLVLTKFDITYAKSTHTLAFVRYLKSAIESVWMHRDVHDDMVYLEGLIQKCDQADLMMLDCYLNEH